MSLIRWGLGRDIDPLFGITDVLGDYDRQMRRMMRDFNRLENQFLGSTGNVGVGGVGGVDEFPLGLTSLMDRSTILPRIVDQDGQKVAQYNFDIKGFRPEDVHIQTTQDGRLVVTGRHEEQGDDYQVSREFHRMVILPEGTKVEDMKSRLRPDGVLSIHAPLAPQAIQQQQQDQFKEIPIQHAGSQAIQQQGQGQQQQQGQEGKQSSVVQEESERRQQAA
jgi:HSP20 family molecular chaperone IbpA